MNKEKNWEEYKPCDFGRSEWMDLKVSERRMLGWISNKLNFIDRKLDDIDKKQALDDQPVIMEKHMKDTSAVLDHLEAQLSSYPDSAEINLIKIAFFYCKGAILSDDIAGAKANIVRLSKDAKDKLRNAEQ